MKLLKNRIPRSFLILYLISILIIIFLAIFTLYNIRQSLIFEAGKNLQSIGKYKADELTHWVNERKGDAIVIPDSYNFQSEINELLDAPGNVKLQNIVLSHFRPVHTYYRYQDVLIADSTGKIFLSIAEVDQKLSDESRDILQKSIRNRNLIFSDFYYCSRHKGMHIDFYSPVYPVHGNKSRLRALILLRVNPVNFVFPLLQSWPVPSKSSETLLIKKQNDSIIYLNELRHLKKTALQLKFPIKNQKLPAAMAAKGIEGIVEGTDYRNVEVLCFISKIPGTPWYMINKTDISEILGSMSFWTITTILIALSLMVFIGAILLMIINQRNKEHFKSLYELELQKEVLSKHYDYLLKYANDIILLVSIDHRIIDCNEKAVITYGYTREELLQMKVDQLVVAGLRESIEGTIQEILIKQGVIFESVQQKKDGTSFPVEISSRTIQIDNKTFVQSIIRDITERKLSEKAIQESEIKFRLIFEHSPIGIAASKKGIILYANQAYAKLFGFSETREVSGMQIGNFIHPDSRQELLELNRKREHKFVVTEAYETQGIRKDGATFPFFVNVVMIQLDNEPATLGFFQDLTAQKNAQSALVKSEKRYRMLFSSMVEGFALHNIVMNEEGKVVDYRFLDINPAFEKLTGLKSAEIIGKSVTDVIPGIEQVWIERYGNVALTGEPITFDEFNTTLNKLFRVIAFSPKKYQFAVLFEDITESRKIQEEIRQLNQELENRVKERTLALEIANKELESFSYSVSHDLRSPLRSLDGFSQALLEDQAENLNEQGKNYLNRIRAASQKMASLIDDLLNLSRISRQNMKLEKINLSEAAESICNELRSEYPSRTFETRITPDLWAQADNALIRIALHNLFSNAFKFSSKVDKPEISFGVLEPQPGVSQEFFICDNGAGFDMKYSGKLFGVFQRLHTQDEFPGTGIGLTIVHRIIQRHGGHIRVNSEINSGTCFFFRFTS